MRFFLCFFLFLSVFELKAAFEEEYPLTEAGNEALQKAAALGNEALQDEVALRFKRGDIKDLKPFLKGADGLGYLSHNICTGKPIKFWQPYADYWEREKVKQALTIYLKAFGLGDQSAGQKILNLCAHHESQVLCEMAIEYFRPLRATNAEAAFLLGGIYKIRWCFWKESKKANESNEWFYHAKYGESLSAYGDALKLGHVKAFACMQELLEKNASDLCGSDYERCADNLVQKVLIDASFKTLEVCQMIVKCYNRGYQNDASLRWQITSDFLEKKSFEALKERYSLDSENRQGYQPLFDYFCEEEQNGNQRVYFYLAHMYEYGNGTARDYLKAANYYVKALGRAREDLALKFYHRVRRLNLENIQEIYQILYAFFQSQSEKQYQYLVAKMKMRGHGTPQDLPGAYALLTALKDAGIKKIEVRLSAVAEQDPSLQSAQKTFEGYMQAISTSAGRNGFNSYVKGYAWAKLPKGSTTSDARLRTSFLKTKKMFMSHKDRPNKFFGLPDVDQIFKDLEGAEVALERVFGVLNHKKGKVLPFLAEGVGVTKEIPGYLKSYVFEGSVYAVCGEDCFVSADTIMMALEKFAALEPRLKELQARWQKSVKHLDQELSRIKVAFDVVESRAEPESSFEFLKKKRYTLGREFELKKDEKAVFEKHLRRIADYLSAANKLRTWLKQGARERCDAFKNLYPAFSSLNFKTFFEEPQPDSEGEASYTSGSEEEEVFEDDENEEDDDE